jgi:hypothetical protein
MNWWWTSRVIANPTLVSCNLANAGTHRAQPSCFGAVSRNVRNEVISECYARVHRPNLGRHRWRWFYLRCSDPSSRVGTNRTIPPNIGAYSNTVRPQDTGHSICSYNCYYNYQHADQRLPTGRAQPRLVILRACAWVEPTRRASPGVGAYVRGKGRSSLHRWRGWRPTYPCRLSNLMVNAFFKTMRNSDE